MENNEIKNDSPVTSTNRHVQGSERHPHQMPENDMEYIPDIQQEMSPHRDNPPPFAKRIKKGAGLLLLASVMSLAIGIMCHTSTSVNASNDAQTAIETRTSTTLPIGARLMSKDDHYVGGDMTITHTSSAQKANIYIWDYAAEDGDYVQVYIDGTPLGKPFMIKNKPTVFNVPTVGEVKVVGTRDGGGGITYAVRYELNQTTYFNGMDQGGSNVYTLVRE